MPAGEYVAGALCFGAMSGAALGAAWLLVSRRYRELAGADRIVALGLYAVLAVLAVHLLPAMLGVLSRASVLAASALLLALATLVPRASAPAAPPAGDGGGGPPAGADGPVAVWLNRAAIGLLGLLGLAVAHDQAFVAPTAVDTLNFHLPGVAAWIETGSIWQIDVYLPFVAPGHYPNNGDALLLAAVLPWQSDFLAHLVLWPVYALVGVAVYALARELGAARQASISAAVLILALPAVILPALINTYPDALMLFGFAAGLVFLVRHARGGETRELVAAGLALGLSFGTKWYGVSAVAIVLLVWFVATWARGRGLGRAVRDGAALAGLVLLAGGVWLLRNWIETGNPVFPVKVAPFGIELFDAPRDVVRERAGFTIADYLGDPGVWGEYILPQYRDALAFAGAVLLAGLVLAAVRLRGAAGRGPVASCLAAAVVILLVYVVTPYSAGGAEGAPTIVGGDSRYAVPALVLAAAALAWSASRLRRGPEVLAGLAALAVIDAVTRISDDTVSLISIDAGNWLGGLALAALAALAWLAWRSLSRAGDRRLVAAALVLVVGVAAVAGYGMQKRFHGNRYLGADPAVDAILADGSEPRVGLAGVWDNGISPVLPAFGPRLENEVAYLGPDVDGFLRRYPTRDEFVARVEEDGYEYVLVGHGIPRRPMLREERWARSAGFEEVASSDRLTLLRAPSPQ
ncbi:MAG TPA: phospholipid carrier-dependent glycosyltransferase [Solirubrobacterales bacterium]